ncbi:Replication factor C subunit 1 [Babesia bigemina]|uniref:Replication factor C subunit 1 n=1 Tax=Babesia bigemina TaxID=5866 RepID=A0A061DDQ8_BABBI|nr:Replication factor C subunit 1 [Babesia bigemina]CDR96480.1 Replication factor C subunit 1 [Babesia bigemina]|eukprot:XP_012768666.1 Replication factor C subunit 1 [Babesia bigemina]
MDIRSFFGGIKKAAPAAPEEPERPSERAFTGELKTTIRRSIDESAVSHGVKQGDTNSVVASVKREGDEDDEVAIGGRRKRLKRLVDSDDDSDGLLDQPGVTAAQPQKESGATVRTYLKDEQGGAAFSPAEGIGKTSDVQLDIDCYTTSGKNLVNLSEKVTKARKPSIDLDSYLCSVGVGDPAGKASPISMFTSPVRSERAKQSPKRELSKTADVKSEITTQTALTKPVPEKVERTLSASHGAADLFGDDEVLPSSANSSAATSPVRSGKRNATLDARIPEGEVDGMRFVFTGVLEAIDRDSVLQLVRKLGGIPVTGVSGKTNYLVCGEKLEDGRHYKTGTKYKKAVELNKQQRADIRILNEAQFLELIDYDKVCNSMAESMKSEATKQNMPSAPLTKAGAESGHKLPFCEKYRPSRLSDLAGNENNIRKVVEWLQSWSPGSGPACALLSGPPGVGKTTTAKLVAAECGYECVEFNASDLRNKSAVEKISMLATGGQSFSFTGQCEMKRTLVLLDEVDGMGAGDRGGLQAVAALLPRSRCPMICICNDRHNQKMTTLGNKSLDVRFSSPTLAQFRNRMKLICDAEGVTVPADTVAQLYEQGGGDFRHALNAIEFNTLHEAGGSQRSSNVGDAKDIGHTKNLFDAAGRLFNVRATEFETRVRDMEQYFFIDYNMMPLMIQENYLKYLPPHRGSLPILQKLSRTFVEADIVEEFLKRVMLSSVLPAMAIVSSGGTCRERLMFPQFLGRFSTTTKNRNFLSEIGKHLGPRSLVRSHPLVTEGYLNIIYTRIMKELATGDIDATAALIESYGLNRDLVVDALCSLRLKSQENLYEKVETRKKTALTKRLNELSVKVAPMKRKKETVDRIVDEDEAEPPVESDAESSASEGKLVKKNQKPAKKRATAKAAPRGKK